MTLLSIPGFGWCYQGADCALAALAICCGIVGIGALLYAVYLAVTS